MSISVDNKLLPLGSLSPATEAGEALREADLAAGNAAALSQNPVLDAQALLASEAWPGGARKFDLAAMAAQPGASGADRLDSIAADILSYLT